MATSRGTAQSAAWAFAQTFLPLPPGTIRRRAGTNNLPAELLFIIFKLAFLNQLNWRMAYASYDFDALSPSLFPFALAAVCSLWRDVISSVPLYWTNVVVFVDSELTCPEAISSQFLWSRDLMLDVVVVGRAVDTQGTMSKVMKTHINPNLNRMRTLRFNVKSSSCLPLFPVDFGSATELTRLRLECAQDDGGRDESDSDIPMNEMESELQFLMLDKLIMDCRTYINAWKRDNEAWLDAVGNLNDLTVTSYTPRAGESFSTHDFALPLKDLEELRHLHVVNVDLSLSESHGSPTTPWLGSLETLELRDIRNFLLVAELLDLMEDTFHTTLIKSALGRPADHFGRHRFLTLQDIDETEDMVSFLDMWRGAQLTVRRCPGFNDRVLDTILRGESMEYLRIIDCPNFSVEALKRLVGTLVYPDGSERLEVLTVSGQLLPPQFSDAIEWFTARRIRYQQFDHCRGFQLGVARKMDRP